ncbi:MAG: hypothetical protein GY908_10410 [Flavobacteriales bacterium]|nr:hypothetical protein [Flavobacteriales bacterium]
MALKKISELALAQQNEIAGVLLSITNFASEKADTRNWQSLPSQIQFARIPLKEGTNHVELTLENGDVESFDVEGNGKIVFKNIVTY